MVPSFREKCSRSTSSCGSCFSSDAVCRDVRSSQLTFTEKLIQCGAKQSPSEKEKLVTVPNESDVIRRRALRACEIGCVPKECVMCDFLGTLASQHSHARIGHSAYRSYHRHGSPEADSSHANRRVQRQRHSQNRSSASLVLI